MGIKVGGRFFGGRDPNEPRPTLREALIERMAFIGTAGGITFLVVGVGGRAAGLRMFSRSESEQMVVAGIVLLIVGVLGLLLWMRDRRVKREARVR